MQEEQKQEKNKKSFVDEVWDFLASVKLAVITFCLIGLSSIVGTILEQNAEYYKNIQILSSFVGESYAPAAYRIFESLGFMDMYHTWWFIGFQMLFAVNLIICSLDRIPPVWRAAREKAKPLKEEQFKGFPIKSELMLGGAPEANKEKLAAFMKSAGFRKFETEAEPDGGYQLYANKQPYSRLGIYITHLSILVILIGAVLGVFIGFKGYLNIPEGWSYPIAFGRVALTQEQDRERDLIIDAVMEAQGNVQAAAARLGVDEKRLRGRMSALGVEDLGFSVRLDDFEVEFYEPYDTPKEYASQLTVIEGGKEIIHKRIEVNSPLIHKGYTFYQSSYSRFGRPQDYTYKLKAAANGAAAEELSLKMNEPFTVPGSDIEVSIVDFSPSAGMDKSGKVYTYNEDLMNNPAVRLYINSGGVEYYKWIWKRVPQTWNVSENIKIELRDVWGSQFTGLQVRKDPGVWVVYLGCLIMGVGLYMAFFMSHRRIWVRAASSGKGGTRLTLAASAHKNREGFERTVHESISKLTEGGSK